MTPPTEEPVKKRSPADFIFGKVIGEGSFSTVYLAKDIYSNKEVAIKVLEKRHIIREKKMNYVLLERDILSILSDSRYFVRLYCTFQDSERLYYVLTYARNGELFPHINRKDTFGIACTKYYSAQLVLALETLKSKEIIHRDLKPENILFDENWNLLITDFGSAKLLSKSETKNQESKRKNSFVGTAQYVSPELLNGSEAVYASDLWALGCIVYQMLTGVPPFLAGSEYLIFQKILKLEYSFPKGFDEAGQDLIKKLLVIAPEERLGASDKHLYTSIRNHKFFCDIDWDNLGPPPKIVEDVPQSSKKLNKTDQIPDNLEPGFDHQIESRLQLDMICNGSTNPVRKKSENRTLIDLNSDELERRLEIQKLDKWHELVEGNLILRQGLIDKKKGIFARRRMFLLTQGPHLYYIDPATMEKKGEIPWSANLQTELKSFKIFYVHTPLRTYYLEDPNGYAMEWCKDIEEVKAYYYPPSQES